MQVTITQAKDLVMDTLRAQLVPFLTSSPGIGKSSLAAAIAEEYDLELIDVRLSQMDPADLLGFPMTQGDKAGYLPMDTFPIEGDKIPEGKKGWLLLLDEFNSAPMSVQAAAYKIVLDRMVGQHKLHPKVATMAAGNLTTDKAIVNRISTAMQSRLIHFEIKVDLDSFIKWADNNKIDHRIKSFVQFKPEALHKFDPNHNEETFPCPRTWEFTSRLIKPMDDLPITKLPLIAGAIGEGMAREFFSYSQVYGKIPTIGQIASDPENVSMGDEPSVHHALAGLVGHHMTVKNADNLMKFLSRLGIDYQVITLRAAIARDPEIMETKAVKGWISHHADELM